MGEIAKHVAASAALLNVLQGRPGFAEASRTERLRLQGLICGSRGLQTAELAAIAQAVQEAPFEDGDRAGLLDTVASAATAPLARSMSREAVLSGRAPLQNYEALWKFLPQWVWDAIREGNAEKMVGFLMTLGLRNPSEATGKVAALSFLAGSEGMDKAVAMDGTARMTTMNVFKKMIRDAAKASPRPLVLLTALPESPAHLLADQRLLYESAYANGGPAEAPFTEVQLQVLSVGTRCRAIKRPLALAPPGAPAPLQLGTLQGSSTPGVADILAWGSAMVKQMTDMQAAIAMLQANCAQVSAGAPARLPLPPAPAPAANALPASSPPPRTAMPSLSPANSPPPAAMPSPSPAISAPLPAAIVELPTVQMPPVSPPREVGAPTPVPPAILEAVVPTKKRKEEPQRKSVADATDEILRSLSAGAPAGADGDESGGKGRKDKSQDSKGGRGSKGGKVDKGGQGSKGGKVNRGGQGSKGSKVKTGGQGSKGGGAAVCLLNHEKSRSQYIVRFGTAAPSKIFRYDEGSSKSAKTAWNEAKRFARSRCADLGLKVPESVL